MRYSEIDNKLAITENSWVISIARLPKTLHREHAFLIIEGVENGEPVIWFIDLVRKVDGKIDEGRYIRGIQGQSKIRIENFRDGENLIFRCKSRMMRVDEGDEIVATSWNIQREKIETLINNIKIEKMNPPKFHLMGKGNITTWSSPSDGHSCFTWAKEKLHSLEDKRIVIEEDLIDKWITSVTSRRLPRENNNSSYLSFFKEHPKATITAASIIGAGLYHGTGCNIL